jgi:Domain of unknown function (DUF4440)
MNFVPPPPAQPGYPPGESLMKVHRAIVTFVLLLALATTSCSMWPDKKHLGWREATGGEALERLLWQSIQRQEWQRVEEHTSATFTAVTASGTQDRDAWLAGLRLTQIASFDLTGVTVTPNAGTVTVAYRLTVHGKEAANSSTPVRAMTVWQQQKSGWVAIAHAETPDVSH